MWNGREWANYGIFPSEDNPKMRLGPLGERIFSIAVNPAAGNVWMATNAGLARYSPQTDSWSYRTRRDGLPTDQIQALAFDSFGTCYAGTQCEGLAIGQALNDYTHWEVVRGPDAPPPSVVGQGLPSNQINDVLVADDDTIYLATKCGLARSSDGGTTWNYLRGIDWQAKTEGRFRSQKPQIPSENLGRELLREDYVTNPAEDPNGLLMLGYRTKGYEMRRPLSDRAPFVSAQDKNAKFPYVSVVASQSEDPAILGSYPGGVSIGLPAPAFAPDARERAALAARRGWKTNFVAPAATVAPLPASAKAPSLDEMDALIKPLSGLSEALPEGGAIYEADDWRTKGDWVGRYGRHYGVMCAARAPLNHYFGLETSYEVQGQLGPHIKGKDSLRHWVHWVKTDNPNSLYDPVIGYRRQSEWDDHGETYPLTWEGSDVWAKVTVPMGVHRLSLHFFNKDGLQGDNRARDYLVEIKSCAATLEQAGGAPTLAKARVRDFWNAVYKRFVVRGPATYWVKVGRDGSFNTILDAVFLDKITGPRTFAYAQPLSYMGRFAYQPATWEGMTAADSPQALLLQRARIWEWKLDAALGRQNSAPSSSALRILALRALAAQPKTLVPLQLLARWRWKCALWTKRDRDEWKSAMQEGREAFFVLNPHLREVEW